MDVSHDSRAFLDKGDVNGVSNSSDMTSLLTCEDVFQLDPSLGGAVLSWLRFTHPRILYAFSSRATYLPTFNVLISTL